MASKKDEAKPEEDATMKEEAAEKEEQAEGEEAAEEPKEPERPKEPEQDAPADARRKVAAGAVCFHTDDTTLNVLPVAGGRLLMTLTEGGCQYLLASARASVGVKAGRYMFEVKIVEALSPGESQAGGGGGRAPQPRQLVRVGVSAAGSSLLLADGPDNVCFDSEGYFVHEKSRKKVSQKFTHGQTVSVVLNLDAESAQANTISLFRNGARASEPQPLPEGLRGRALFPTVTYKNVTVQAHFGPAPLAKLPFLCRPLADAAEADVEVAAPRRPAGGKCEVVFPVGLPEQGFFDWVDSFLEKNPGYTELSDRKILEWATKSGVWRPKAQAGATSGDRPDVKFGIPALDDHSVRRVLEAVVSAQGRCYVVPELRANLVPSERQAALRRFSTPDFTKKAIVVMGEPAAEYKERVGALLLADKRAKADAERKKAAQEEERKRLLEEKKKKAEEARRAKEIAQKKKEGKEVDEEAKEPEPAKEEEKKEETKDDAVLELTDEEKALWYRKLDVPDLAEKVLAKSYASFALPSKDEGFDEVSFAWQPEAACSEMLKKWVMEKKLTQRVEDLTPGTWFKENWAQWQKALQDFRKKQNEWKDPVKRKAALAKKKQEAKKDGEEGEKEEDKPMEINSEDIDVQTVEDVTDLGNGEPLFAHFVYEDWALLSARCEMHLLLHGFKKDLDDADRPSFSEGHLAFYYNKYFKKSHNVKQYGVEKFAGFAEMIKDTVAIGDKNDFLQVQTAEDTAIAIFVKATEEDRRERQRRIDAGDETAKLKFVRPAPAAPPGRQQGSQHGGHSGGHSGGHGGQGGGRPMHGSAGHAGGGQKRPYGGQPSYGGSKHARGSYGSSNGGGYYRR